MEASVLDSALLGAHAHQDTLEPSVKKVRLNYCQFYTFITNVTVM